MPTDSNRMLTVALTSDIWDHIIDRLGDYADEAEERPWLGDCHDCDKADPGKCPQHQQEAEYGAQVRVWRDQIVDQLTVQTATTADLVRRTGMPLDTSLRDVILRPYIAVRNLLMRDGILTLGDLAAVNDEDLCGIRNFGAGRYAELRAVLRKVTAS
ncbi:DNA-directed RNA polymerase subunit alpha C-terminal domain-containing protein [Nonomuraea cavernae]|uniref:RNA polymerase alpha subunit C-terminal domain-containing protein n=1 Tax=Nonomuraea cavernae TaxID=2045107 RepID=A0A917YPK5_9ACTN|nr:DNA-directed RNA polymerase subunit alpha C-terminal domain-containing protein [Nonomuraea cavernae]MCA2184716.1 hypothetical protein [Nonomuraea cavernae]GGO62974.1 hypothetical protein GCM10012289_08800 [Nonomuraea cavernae]